VFMLRRIFLLASLSGLLAGCALSTPSPAPTILPQAYIPTIIAMTSEAALATSQALSPTAAPANTEPPSVTPIPSTPLPTQTFTPQPNIPLAQIQFLSPGPMSRIISPLSMQLLIVSGESGVIQVDLLGEDGRLLGRVIDRVDRLLSGAYRVYKIPFQIRAAAESGYLQISTKDKQGRMRALNSLPLILLSAGANQITPAGNIVYERAVLSTPKDMASVSGGDLNIEGRIWPFNQQPVFIDLIGPDNKIINTRILTLSGLDPQEFSTTLPYKVADQTMALLSIRQMDPSLNIPIYIYTQQITLNP